MYAKDLRIVPPNPIVLPRQARKYLSFPERRSYCHLYWQRGPIAQALCMTQHKLQVSCK